MQQPSRTYSGLLHFNFSQNAVYFNRIKESLQQSSSHAGAYGFRRQLHYEQHETKHLAESNRNKTTNWQKRIGKTAGHWLLYDVWWTDLLNSRIPMRDSYLIAFSFSSTGSQGFRSSLNSRSSEKNIVKLGGSEHMACFWKKRHQRRQRRTVYA